MSDPLTRNALAAARYLAPGLGLFMSGSILTLSYFSVPILRASVSTPSSNPAVATGNITKSLAPPAAYTTSAPAFSLQQLRALFSSGSHIYPPTIIVTSALFFALAYALPSKRVLYAVAGASTLSIAPFTTRVMVPLCNGRLIELDEMRKGDKGAEIDPKEVEGLLRSFEWINAVRAGLGLVGGLVGLWASVF